MAVLRSFVQFLCLAILLNLFQVRYFTEPAGTHCYCRIDIDAVAIIGLLIEAYSSNRVIIAHWTYTGRVVLNMETGCLLLPARKRYINNGLNTIEAANCRIIIDVFRTKASLSWDQVLR